MFALQAYTFTDYFFFILQKKKVNFGNHCLVFLTNENSCCIYLQLGNTTIACKLHYKILFMYLNM